MKIKAHLAGLATLVLFLASASYAQLFVGGEAQVVYSHSSSRGSTDFGDPTTDAGYLSITPSPFLGYNITDRMALGLGVGTNFDFYFEDYADADNEIANSLRLFAFFHYKLIKNERFAFALRLSSAWNLDLNDDATEGFATTETLSPMLDVTLTDKLGICVSLGGIGFTYSHQKTDYSDTETYGFTLAANTGAALGLRYNL
jgi:hypothetical protein